MWANFISHCDRRAQYFTISARKLFHIRRKPNISLKKYRNKLRMIYKAYALIYLQKCDIINSTINKNLADGKNNGIVELVKKQV